MINEAARMVDEDRTESPLDRRVADGTRDFIGDLVGPSTPRADAETLGMEQSSLPRGVKARVGSRHPLAGSPFNPPDDRWSARSIELRGLIDEPSFAPRPRRRLR